jgi:hypothetical protein
VPKPKPVRQTPAAKKPVARSRSEGAGQTKKLEPAITNVPVPDSALTTRPVRKDRAIVPLPKALITRANPIIKHIETVSAEVEIDLYDNGEIDGDTVTIYHNNTMIVSRAALSAKAVSFRINVNGTNPHHELVMVANNLGSIPPNTSLMIVTAKDKRYEVFISSSEQKNAKVVIDLKSP